MMLFPVSFEPEFSHGPWGSLPWVSGCISCVEGLWAPAQLLGFSQTHIPRVEKEQGPVGTPEWIPCIILLTFRSYTHVLIIKK